jgi:DNA-binding NtrC family response regulator
MAIRVLVADPDEALLATYQTRLVRDGFVVATARSGLECVETMREFRPQLLILEPAMPWGGGDGVLDVMHDVWEIPSVPVFVITSHETLARIDFRQFPLVTHLQTKPVAPDVLVKLERHIAD